MVAQDATKFQDLLKIQTDIATQVVLDAPAGDYTSIGAVAQSCSNDVVFSSAIVLDALMNVVEVSTASAKITMPYIAGLLFFREGRAAIAALKKLSSKPDVLIVHGCGINHPRFAGFASHLGVVRNTSTIGVSKTTLCGEYAEPDEAYRCVPLEFKSRQLGFVSKTMIRTKPIFISPGHLISLKNALEVVQRCVINHRLPEPLRLAHIKARQARFVASD
ncbi:MAG: endonuclease V [Euryarchaeota archaeon]|nr:endonuclease V [Euryarchaeota archaeon]